MIDLVESLGYIAGCHATCSVPRPNAKKRREILTNSSIRVALMQASSEIFRYPISSAGSLMKPQGDGWAGGLVP